MSADLSESQREALRERFLAGIGSRPDPEEFARQADESAEIIASTR